MASKWHPRADGAIRLERRPEGMYHSRFRGASSDAVMTETTWLSASTEISASPLASEWLSAWQSMKSGKQDLVACQMARWGTPHGGLPDSSLLSVWNGTWSSWKWQSGEVLEIWGWSDSTGYDSRMEWEKSTAMVCTDGKAIENPGHGRHLIGCSMTRSQRHYFGTL